MRNLVLACLAALTALALAGCGLAERAVERATERVLETATEKVLEGATGISVDTEGSSITFSGEDGEKITLSAEGSEGELVEGFPLPVVDGAKVMGSGRLTANGKSSYSAELSFSGDLTAVADFYEQALKAEGMEVSRSEVEVNGETAIVLSGESETKTGLITVVRKQGEKTGRVNVLFGDKQ